MYTNFQSLRNSTDRTKLRAFIESTDSEALSKMLCDNISSTSIPKVLNDIFQACSDSEACQLKRRKLVESILKHLGRSKESMKQADSIIDQLISDFSGYSKKHLLKLVDFCLTLIHSDDDELKSWKDILPILLSLLENEQYITYMDTEVSGSEYKLLIVKAICNSHWNTDHLPSLTKMFGDMALKNADRTEVLRALCSKLPDLSLDQVPPFVYQALKMCCHKDGKYLLNALKKYFETSYSRAVAPEDTDSLDNIGQVSLKEVQDVESTVLYHIYQAAQLNNENMKDFIQYLKTVSNASEYILQPFVLAVLLSVSGIYEQQVFEILKLAIIRAVQDEEERQNSAWLRHLLPRCGNVTHIVVQVVNTSNKDRHLVLKGLVRLAFTLMGSDGKLKGNMTFLWRMGTEILQEVMKKRHETVPTVLQELIEKIIMAGVSITHYTDCLGFACRKLSAIVLDHQVWIITILDQLLVLPGSVTIEILHAVFPLMHISPNIRENLILTLRKALYRKGVSKRQMAVTGFLEMLKYSKIHSLNAMMCSQPSNSSTYAVSSSYTSTLTQVTLECNTQGRRSCLENDKTLSYEILEILKKCFTYDYEVRLHLYKGLYNTVQKNSDLADTVMDIFLVHFNNYLETDEDILPPVKLDICADVCGTETIPKEPIAELIFVMQKIYVGKASNKSVVFDKVLQILESLCKRMVDTELEHLNLDNRAELVDDSKSQKKIENLKLVIGIYEALMAFRIGEWYTGREESSLEIDALFNGYTRSVDFIKNLAKSKKGAGGKGKKDKDTNNTTMKKSSKSSHIKLPNTVMDLDVVRKCLTLLSSQSTTRSSQSGGSRLRRNHDFRRYILQTCAQLLQNTKPTTDSGRWKSKDQSSDVDTFIDIAGTLYKNSVSDLKNALERDEQTAVVALECFKEICYSMCTSFSSELSRFLSTVLDQTSQSATNVDLQLQDAIFSLETNLEMSLVEEEESEVEKRVPFLLLEIIEQFTSKINFNNCKAEKVFDWMKKITQTENVPAPIAGNILKLLLRLEEYTGEYGETLNDICVELCEKLGTIDETALVSEGKYKILREDTASQAYNTLNNCVKQKLHNVSWLLLRVKADEKIIRGAGGVVEEEDEDNVRQKERSLCRQLSYIIHILLTLANTSIEPGPCTDLTFKNLQLLYHLLGDLTKYFYGKSNSQNAAFQAVKFIQVVQVAGNLLKSAFYKLVTYVEENQNKLRSRADSYAQRNKVLKETKAIPRVVYEIEQFTKEVLLLDKKTGIPLRNSMKRSITRDFRIKNSQLAEGLEKMDVSMFSQNTEPAEGEQTSALNTVLDESSDEAVTSPKRSRMASE